MSNPLEKQYSLNFDGNDKKPEEVSQIIKKETAPKPIGDVSGELEETLQKKFPDIVDFSNVKKNTFTPEGWFIHEAKGTETMEEIKELPEFKESTEEEIKALFEKYSDKFKSEPASSDKSI